jgi:predicted NBD/HSP70 family sugar kinase
LFVIIDPHRSHASLGERPGTLEDLCSKVGLLNAYYQRSGELAELSTLLSRLEQADAIAQAVVNEWGTYLSWGVRGLVGVLNPERIVFGGQLAVLVPYVQDQLDEMLLCCLPDGSGYGFDSAARFRLEISKFGEDSAAIGGAVLVYQSLFQMPDLLLLHQ